MDVFTSAYLANLAANLSALILPKAARRLQEQWQGEPSAAALQRCLEAGVLGMVSKASLDEPDQEHLLADIFSDFFQDRGVAQELTRLLQAHPLSAETLAELFEDAGYDAQTLPGLQFAETVAAFEAAFLEAAALEPLLRDPIQTHQGWAQTALQREMVALMRQMVRELRAAKQPVGIQAGVITAENVVSGAQTIHNQIIYQWPDSPIARREAVWESHYLRTLLAQCDALDLAAIDEAYLPDDGADGTRLRDVFTPLYLAYRGQLVTRLPEEEVADILRQLIQPNRKADDQRERLDKQEKAEPIPAVTAIAALPRLIILGYPGGGKSTLLNYLAAQLAARRLGLDNARADGEEALPGWSADVRPLPVRIILRRFAATLPERATAEELPGLVWNYIQKQMNDWGCGESFTALKETVVREGGVILFDGLDEVRETDADNRRSLIKAAIAAFAAPLQNCRIVVTCRDYAYQKGDAWRLPESEFPVFSLSLFQRRQIERFTQNWYGQVGPRKGWTAQRSRQEAEKLASALHLYPHLRELAQYPLLLTLMAQVHGRDGFLPEDRADLYERAVKLLLAHWENRLELDIEGGRQVEPGLAIQLGVPVAVLRRALARVAFAAHERQEQEAERDERTADIHRLDLQDELKTELGSLDKAETVIRYIQHRAGLLQERDRYTYAFPHRTFQEYLAAAHIWHQNAADPVLLLKERVERDPTWWREVFLLAAGIQKETPTTVGTLISELLYADPPAADLTAEQATIPLLAGQAAQEAGLARQITPGAASRLTTIYRRVQNWLLAVMTAEAVPVKERAAAGRILARLGDPRPGVGLDPATGLPDIAWGQELPAGTYTLGGDKDAYDSFKRREVAIANAFQLSRYPITYAQFQAFIEADDFANPRWWAGMPEVVENWGDEKYAVSEVGDQAFPYANHPREMVSWYQATAFCRWLSDKLGYTVELPHEYEWEAVARYPDGRFYPWGNRFDPQKANTQESGIGQTTAVGLYPANELGLCDLSGNVWEWCRNKYENPNDDKIDGSAQRRVLRGGSWFHNRYSARAAYRVGDRPDYRDNSFGFRVVVVRRSPSHP
jgi:formylglycine-generating enzyme required for sulfatase activity